LLRLSHRKSAVVVPRIYFGGEKRGEKTKASPETRGEKAEERKKTKGDRGTKKEKGEKQSQAFEESRMYTARIGNTRMCSLIRM
jgi:hypothetical protein